METEKAPACDLERIARALSDPRRFEILEIVSNQPGLSCCEIVERVDLRQPTVSHHLKELILSGLVEPKREGTFIRYQLKCDALHAYLESLRARLTPP
jgi:ArsR family transcriptional regulator, arsenate/arsenite/antimonite-responsive transcriptional repressor